MISFKGRHHQQEIILQCVRWYVAYSLNYRDLEELTQERGYSVGHSTVQRWVVHYTPRIEKDFRKNKKLAGHRWRMLKKGQNKSSLPAWEQFYVLAAAG